MKKLILLLCPIIMTAQDVKIGSWKNYLSYNSASYISETNNKIFCVASGSIFYIDKNDETINRMSKITGLSDINVNKIAYSYDLNVVIIAYQNCNIDIIKSNQIVNISDIKRKEVSGIKEINNITIKENIAYLSTSIGLILVDLEKNEIKDTYRLGGLNENIKINDCSFIGDSIIVATSNGLYFANQTIANLSDYNNWSVYDTNLIRSDNILYADNNLLIDSSENLLDISYNQNTLISIYADSICINNSTCITHPKFENVKYAWRDNSENIWVADSINGLLKFNDSNYEKQYIPSGPIRNDIFSLEYLDGNLYQCHGGHINFSSSSGIKSGVSIKNNFDEWMNYDRYTLGDSKDILAVASYDTKQYYASWKDGVIEMQDNNLVAKYGYNNTNGALEISYNSSSRVRISDLKVDLNGSLWGLNSLTNNPLFVKNKDGEWMSFSMGQDRVGLYFDQLLIDQQNQKWGIIARGGGLFVYNDNNTIHDASDDNYKFLNTNVGFGNLPSLWAYAIEQDLEGDIWVGTDKGIGVFYNPGDVFSGYNFDAQQILIQDGSYGQYLLSEEKITCIKIDAANRKWIGTEKSGVFLISEDGLQQILHFTSENSPLFSNNIIDIAINHENGEVFFGTEKGLISYRSDATNSVEAQSKVHIFPNPVRQEYTGPIAIRGLTQNANFKITDTDGNLVFDGYANGGQAIWNGKNKNDSKASTGIYLVFASDVFGNEKIVGKILFIR